MTDLSTIINFFYNQQTQLFTFLVSFQFTNYLLLALLFAIIFPVFVKIITNK